MAVSQCKIETFAFPWYKMKAETQGKFSNWVLEMCIMVCENSDPHCEENKSRRKEILRKF